MDVDKDLEALGHRNLRQSEEEKWGWGFVNFPANETGADWICPPPEVAVDRDANRFQRVIRGGGQAEGDDDDEDGKKNGGGNGGSGQAAAGIARDGSFGGIDSTTHANSNHTGTSVQDAARGSGNGSLTARTEVSSDFRSGPGRDAPTMSNWENLGSFSMFVREFWELAEPETLFSITGAAGPFDPQVEAKLDRCSA